MLDLPRRPRRNRRNPAIRSMVRETSLSPANLVMPCFVKEGRGESEPIGSMPGCHRHSLDRLVEAAREWHSLGIPAIALFPVTPPSAKTSDAKAALDPDGIVPRALKTLKDARGSGS